MFWSWGGVCAQFSSQHFSPSNFPSTDAKAHYWTASMVINSNFSATSFWPPINPCCFVTQSWDMFQQYKIWHFKTISVPPPQLSVTSICLADKKKNPPVCFRVRKSLGDGNSSSNSLPGTAGTRAQQWPWVWKCLSVQKEQSWVSPQWAGILQGISHWKWKFCFKTPHSLKIFYSLFMWLLYQDRILILIAQRPSFSSLEPFGDQ